MLRQNLLIIGDSAICQSTKDLLIQKGATSVTTMNSTGLTARQVEQKVLNMDIEHILFRKTHSGKTEYIAGYVLKNVTHKKVRMTWIDPPVDSHDVNIDKVSKVKTIEELLPEEENVETGLIEVRA